MQPPGRAGSHTEHVALSTTQKPRPVDQQLKQVSHGEKSHVTARKAKTSDLINLTPPPPSAARLVNAAVYSLAASRGPVKAGAMGFFDDLPAYEWCLRKMTADGGVLAARQMIETLPSTMPVAVRAPYRPPAPGHAPRTAQVGPVASRTSCYTRA